MQESRTRSAAGRGKTCCWAKSTRVRIGPAGACAAGRLLRCVQSVARRPPPHDRDCPRDVCNSRWRWRSRSSTSTSRRWTIWRSSGDSGSSRQTKRSVSRGRPLLRRNRGCFPGRRSSWASTPCGGSPSRAYYGGDPAACQAAVERIAGRGCRFLVFGRNLGVGFVGLADLELPDALRAVVPRSSAGSFSRGRLVDRPAKIAGRA